MSIPSELSYEMLARMAPSKKVEMRQQPFNSSKFTTGNMVQIKIPKSQNSFLNCATNCLTYTMSVTVKTGAAATDANSKVYMLGNAWAPFSRHVFKVSGGANIDEIQNPNTLVNALMDMTVSASEKQSMVSLGFNDTEQRGNFGFSFLPGVIAINSSKTFNFTFSIPIPGVLGQTEKMIPLVAQDLEINLTLDDPANYMYIVGTGLTTANVNTNVSVELSSIEFVGEVLTLEDTAYAQLASQYPNGMTLKSTSYIYAAASLPPSASGSIDLTIPFSLTSMKELLFCVSPSNLWSKAFGSVNPNLRTYNAIIGSQSYPQQPVRAESVAELYYQLSKAWGAFYSAGHSGSMTRANFSKGSTAFNSEYTAYSDIATVDTVAEVENVSLSAKCYFCLDLETINQHKSSLYSGISTKGSTNILRLNFAAALAAVSHSVSLWASYDILVTFNQITNEIIVAN